MTSLGLSLTGRASAQAFTVLHSFTAYDNGPNGTNSDGAAPLAGLSLSGSTLYGTTQGGGSSGRGTVFAVSTDGTGFTNLHSFSSSDTGYVASSGVVLSGSTLYGPAVDYLNLGGGVFRLNTDGTSFATLHIFTAIPNPPYTNCAGCR